MRATPAGRDRTETRRQARHRAGERADPPRTTLPSLALQSTIGNRATGRLLQAKLMVTPPRDRYELEADRIADRVMRMPEGGVHRSAPGGTAPVGGLTAAAPDIARRIDATQGSGRPLPPASRQEMGRKMGADFRGVNIHTGPEAAGLNRALGARAFTVGSDVYFNEGQFDPGSGSGKRLLAHELVHVLQQSPRSGPGLIQRDLPALGAPVPEEIEPLEEDDRTWLMARIEHRLGLAYTKFVDACNAHQRRLREMASSQSDAAALVIDIFLAFATRGLSRVITAGVARAVPREAPDAVYRLALGAMDRSDQIASAVGAVGKRAALAGFRRVITRGETEQFVQDLKQQMSVAVDAIHGSLRDRSDAELSILYFNYDPSIATLDYYEGQLAQLITLYREQVEPIGATPPSTSIYAVKARWIEGSQWRALALTGDTRYHHHGGRPEFMLWISPRMRSLATSATEAINFGSVDTVHYGNVTVPNRWSSAMFSRLDFGSAEDLRECGLVVEPSTGTQQPRTTPCPSCHGETGRGTPPTDFGGLRDYQAPGSLLDELRRTTPDPSQLRDLQEYLEALTED